jgi:hypothetical protein
MAPLWTVSVHAPEVADEFERLGLEPNQRYFAARAAPLGAASLELVVATFFNFSPRAVSRAVPRAWDATTPGQILAAQRSGVDRALRRAFASLDATLIDEALALMRPAAEAASAHPEGRPLFAAYSSLEWPEEPHLALWHAQYLLREFRGDGHIAVLLGEGLTGIEAFAIHIALVPAMQAYVQSRAWTADEWKTAIDALRSAGWLTADRELTLTADGVRRREAIEQRTNVLNLPAYEAIGQAGCDRIIELGPPIAQAIADAELAFPVPRRDNPAD